MGLGPHSIVQFVSVCGSVYLCTLTVAFLDRLPLKVAQVTTPKSMNEFVGVNVTRPLHLLKIHAFLQT